MSIKQRASEVEGLTFGICRIRIYETDGGIRKRDSTIKMLLNDAIDGATSQCIVYTECHISSPTTASVVGRSSVTHVLTELPVTRAP